MFSINVTVSPTHSRLPAICSSHLIPFSLTLSSTMLSLSEDQSSKEWVDGSIGLFIHPLLQGGSSACVGPPGGSKLCCCLADTHLISFICFKLFNLSVTTLTTNPWPIRAIKSAKSLVNPRWLVGHTLSELAAMKL